jgi:AcrR family transcriptional regulator
MYQKQTNPVAIRTQKAFTDALLSLIRERPYEEISVTDICRRADFVRKTFYNHFDSKDDVVRCLISDVFYQLETSMDLKNMSIGQILLVAFQFVANNRESLLLFSERGLIRFAHKSIEQYITKEHILTKLEKTEIDERAYKYISAQISSVLVSIIETWIENQFSDSIEFLAELTQQLMYHPGNDN